MCAVRADGSHDIMVFLLSMLLTRGTYMRGTCSRAGSPAGQVKCSETWLRVSTATDGLPGSVFDTCSTPPAPTYVISPVHTLQCTALNGKTTRKTRAAHPYFGESVNRIKSSSTIKRNGPHPAASEQRALLPPPDGAAVLARLGQHPRRDSHAVDRRRPSRAGLEDSYFVCHSWPNLAAGLQQAINVNSNIEPHRSKRADQEDRLGEQSKRAQQVGASEAQQTKISCMVQAGSFSRI